MRLLIFFGLLLISLVLPSAARAHAELDHTIPAPDSTVDAPLSEMTLVFTEQIEPAFSTVEIHDDDGNPISIDGAHIDVENMTTIHVPLKPLASGTYHVVWHVTSVDTHGTEGEYTFHIKNKQP